MENSLQEGLSGSSEQQVTITAAHEAILKTIREALPVFKTVSDYTPLTDKKKGSCGRSSFMAPAFILSLPSFEREAETTSEQLAISLRWEARVILPPDEKDKERKLRELAGTVAANIDGNRFGLRMKGARFIDASKDEFSSDFAHLHPWLIEFETSMCLGTSCFDEDFTTPEEVFVSISPEIGMAHKEKYQLVNEGTLDELPAS